MGVASPLCRTLIGKKIHTTGRSPSGSVDGMGFNLTTVWGVHKQPRYAFHNEIAAAIAKEARLAGWHVQETPMDILKSNNSSSPQPTPTSERETENLQNKMIPDIAMGPPEHGQLRLYDVKTLGNTRQYTHGPSTVLEQCRVIKDRGDKVDHEYHETARKIDHQRQPELAPHEKGTLESKLNQYGKVRGLAFGFYSEASPDMHKLIQCWVQERTKSST